MIKHLTLTSSALIIFFFAFGQVKKGIEPTLPTRYIIAVQDSPITVKGIKLLDSVLNLRSDTAIIIYSNVGDYTRTESCIRLTKDGRNWTLGKNDKTIKITSNRPDLLMDYEKRLNLKSIMYENIDLRSSLKEDYCYILTVNNKIIETLTSNSKISQLGKLDPTLAPDIDFFERCETFINQIKLE